jgi:hypothetical protein
MSNVKLLNLSVRCDLDVLVVLLLIFYILITFHRITVFIKNLSLMDLHNLCFSIWYHNMLQNGKNQIYWNSTEHLIYVFIGLCIC